MVTTTGKCHCGDLEWEITTEETPVHILCHCSACKLIGGGEYTLNLIVPKDNCKITSETQPNVYTYKGDSGNDVQCFYCPKCTSHPWHYQTVNADNYVVRTALLEGADKFNVAAEVYMKEKFEFQPKIAEAAFETVPPS
ncbi:hypothetical protein TWF106_009815 [Orbilia oligospora]|uniref:CENP-V/GFA domain-containing protein n=1 Tax=Orbilia oligospora TaxID=2813651 RepID=A0A7C8UJG7_ORBOL|nr:hypothetical protein TWF106_009815 [Orbilia oligospora]